MFRPSVIVKQHDHTQELTYNPDSLTEQKEIAVQNLRTTGEWWLLIISSITGFTLDAALLLWMIDVVIVYHHLS